MTVRESLRTAGWVAGLVALVGAPADGQTPARSSRFALDTRAAFLITGTQGFSDRPVLAVDVRFVIVQPHVGGGPGLGVLAGGAIGFAEIFAEAQSESHRWTGGVEFPWALAASTPGGPPIEIVPLLEAGYLVSNGGDRRRGFLGRVALGLRVPLGPASFGFEPLGLTLLPNPDVALPGSSSRLAYEVGILRMTWRF